MNRLMIEGHPEVYIEGSLAYLFHNNMRKLKRRNVKNTLIMVGLSILVLL